MSQRNSLCALYWQVATEKRRRSLGNHACQDYYSHLIRLSSCRDDDEAQKDRIQLKKDVPRTFSALPIQSQCAIESLLPLLWRILVAYVERARSLCASSREAGFVGRCSTLTPTNRPILSAYPQGLNFFAGMSLIVAGAGTSNGQDDTSMEETAFWLLALLLEDVLDPDFFGADVCGHFQMSLIGGMALKNVILTEAKKQCPCLLSALGAETFNGSIGSILDRWIFSLFIGCMPSRLLECLWGHLILKSPYHQDGSRGPLPQGLVIIVAFALAALKCCGEERLRDSQELAYINQRRLDGASDFDLSLEAAEIVQGIQVALTKLSSEQDAHILSNTTDIIMSSYGTFDNSVHLWDKVRQQKQAIVDFADSYDYDEQLINLAQHTGFTVHQISRLRDELTKRCGATGGRLTGIDEATFYQVVNQIMPNFPKDLITRLFSKLNLFVNQQLSFAEVVCGMSALSLGTMDEKLQVCFDLFDTDGYSALTLSNVCDLCSTLFQVALAQGCDCARESQTDDDIAIIKQLVEVQLQENPRPRTFAAPKSNSKQSRYNRQASTISISLRSMLLRLLSAARVPPSGGPRLIAFEDFCRTAHMEPAIIYLFSSCLPQGSVGKLLMGDTPDASSCLLARFCRYICKLLC